MTENDKPTFDEILLDMAKGGLAVTLIGYVMVILEFC
jgi:hypothetical protein